MRRFIVPMLIGLAALTGCASTTQKPVASSGDAPKCDYGPAPGEMQFAFDDAKAAPVEKAAPARTDMATSMRPNAQERPKSGAVHPAIY